jgi:stearoyl-CoA desaturase (delta-9 desaturase)
MATLGYWLIGGWLGIVVGVAAGLVASGLHASFYLLAGGAINGYGHAGTTDRPVGGYATNMPIIAWFTVGEGWHRNHHGAENSPRFGWGRQVDLGWIVIRGLCRLHLAHLTTRGEAGLHRLQTLYATPRSLTTS